jgi:outer membrane usher protein
MASRPRCRSGARRRPLALAIAAVLLGACASVAIAGPGGGTDALGALELPDSGDADYATTDGQALYLEVFVGEQPTHLIAHLEWRGGRLAATAAELGELGVRVPDDAPRDAEGWIALDDLPGLGHRYDEPNQRLVLSVPITLRPEQRLGYATPEAVRAERGHGLVLNYDAYARAHGDQHSLALGTVLRWFGRAGTLEATGVSRSGDGDATGYERLDTRWTYSDPKRMLTWTAGDLVGGALAWTRGVRLGGVQLRRNFGVRPDLVTFPMPRFAGQAAVPSTVELLVNGVEQFGAPINDGPFVLDAFPRLTGSGQATLVVRDALGRATRTTLPLYVDSQRLAPGLTDFSVELGVRREGFGSGADSYGDDVVGSGSWRRGIVDALTLEAHGAFAPDLRLAGIGAVWSPGRRFGLVTASMARSSHAGRAGTQSTLGYQWLGPRFGFDVYAQHAGRGFVDLGTVELDADSAAHLVVAQQRASFWLPLRNGNLAFSALRTRQADGSRDGLRTLSWSRSLPRNASLSLNAFSSDDAGHGVGMSFSLPLGAVDATLSVDHVDGRTQTVASMRRTAPWEGGWGWDVEAGDQGGGFAQASANVRGRQGEAWFGLDHRAGTTGAFAQANGALAWMDGHFFVGRRIDDAFAVVSSHGVAGVPVLYQNRRYGVTDKRGLLLVPGLLGWQKNRLALDPDALGADYRLGVLEQERVPAEGTGLLVDFAVAQVHPALVALRDGDGRPLAAGLEGRIGDATVLVGLDGEAFVEDATAGAVLTVPVADGTCRYVLPAAPAGDASAPMPRLGPLTCERMTP